MRHVPHQRGPRATIRALAVVGCALVLASCAEPLIPQGDAQTLDTAPEELVAVDAPTVALDDAVALLVAALNEIDMLLTTNAIDAATLNQATQTALQQLVYATDAVFPTARSSTERDATGNDAFSVVLQAARAHGGQRGDMVTNAMRDTLAGDLGGWERDPAGMRTQALTSYGETLLATKDAVSTLPADGMRAVAWLAFALTQSSPEVIRDALTNAQIHLEIVTVSVVTANAT